MPIRIITDKAWHSLFARNMFITDNDRDTLKKFVPEFTVIGLSGFKVDPKIDGTRTDTAIVLNFAERTAIIANSLYGGENKEINLHCIKLSPYIRRCTTHALLCKYWR